MSKGNAVVSFRIPADVHERLQAAADRAKVSKSAWALEAVLMALELDEAERGHIPQAILDVSPRKGPGRTMYMPRGRIPTRP